MKINKNYQNIEETYLFSEVAERVRKFMAQDASASLIKMGIVLVAVVAVALVAYILAKGNPVPGYTGTPVSQGMLKLTDTILILTAIAGVGAIAAIIIGEIRLAIANKK